MGSSQRSRRARRPEPPKNSGLYSAVVIHDKEDVDVYATMVDKEDDIEDEEESLPSLLKRLPKDFGGSGDDPSDSDDGVGGAASISGTMIVRTDRRRSTYSEGNAGVFSSYKKPRSTTSASPFWERRRPGSKIGNEEEEENVGDFLTFVVRGKEDEKEEEEDDDGMGTMVRRGGSGGEGGTMKGAVETMHKVGEVGAMGYGRGWKSRSGGGGGNGGGEGSRGTGIAQLRQQCSGKVSSSSIPESVTREDPSANYELLHDLGKDSNIRTSELVAIKVISLFEGEHGHEEICGEIEMLQRCSHSNVVRYLGSYQGEEFLWLFLPLAGWCVPTLTSCAAVGYSNGVLWGGRVADLMNVTDEPRGEYQIAYICREALKDITGGSILLTEQGEVKLGDFGVAAQLTRMTSKFYSSIRCWILGLEWVEALSYFIGTPHWMAPEVIQERLYDGKVDVWALGVSAIEMEEVGVMTPTDMILFRGLPPRATVHPVRVLFMISIELAPMLGDKEKCFPEKFHVTHVPTAAEMLKHKFIETCRSGASMILPKIEKARQIRASMSSQAHDIVSDTTLPREGVELIFHLISAGRVGGSTSIEALASTVPSRSQDGQQSAPGVPTSSIKDNQASKDGVQTAVEGNFGTMIVHDRLETGKTATVPASSRAEESSPATGHVGSLSVSRPGVRALDSCETVSGRALDKLWSIYTAGNTVPIPFLRATDMSLIALLSGNVLREWQRDNGGNIAFEAIQELFTGDTQPKKEVLLPPSVYQRLTSSPT
ncbi:Mitogen-activated protein kinase kinase kinase kinase (MAP4K), germinal center kinase family [Handroanthus impetiginosus]|uniref:Mitogen-activated protein kinase kinase kinase kinase (MAP4K), germinal center kinase family n=1 Tax=Handroanthus impetiginosus TaxID=429701 RepID=A0A2G9HGS9_9LAMI|nr:Mitogen-activated protein kinase kinase kinase kinase (MAP4K), germinal center kinase family [Handroanthus impetiginosus]